MPLFEPKWEDPGSDGLFTLRKVSTSRTRALDKDTTRSASYLCWIVTSQPALYMARYMLVRMGTFSVVKNVSLMSRTRPGFR